MSRPSTSSLWPRRGYPAFAGHDEHTCRAVLSEMRLLLLDPRIRDQLLPHLELILQEGVEFFRRTGKGFHAAVGEVFLDFGALDDLADFGVELDDDVLRHVGRAEIALPRRNVEALH